MIKHDEAKQRLMNINIRSVTIGDLKFFTSYITEQEKKDELLGLYRELHDTYRYPTWKNEKDVQCILKQIKALEEKMK